MSYIPRSFQRRADFSIQDAPRKILDTRCWILDAGFWMLDAGCWMLDAGCWMLDASNRKFHSWHVKGWAGGSSI
jgi:hypothetical protein